MDTTQKLFANQHAPAESMSEADLESIEGIIKSDYALAQFNEGVDVVTFLAATEIFPRKAKQKKCCRMAG